MINDEVNPEAPEIRRKRIRMRAWHRGIKEMDLILGRWADRHLHDASEATLDAFEALMEEPDLDLYQWISEQSPVPDRHAPLIERIRATLEPTLGRGS